jgi:hypothetical protein
MRQKRCGSLKALRLRPACSLRSCVTVALVSLFPCSVSWCQSPQTHAFGLAEACAQVNQYNITAKGDIEHKTSKSCTLPPPDGVSSASASSLASLDLGLSALGSSANLGSGAAGSANAQTATLKPPKGFTGNKVTFSFTDVYALKVSGRPTSANATLCWTITPLKFQLCEIRSTVGQSSGKVSQTLILTKSSKGFQLTIAKDAAAGAVAGSKQSASAGVATSSAVNLYLPKGWTCSYDSGIKCP